MPNIKELQFISVESMNPDGMVILSECKCAFPCSLISTEPGLVEEKCVSF